MVVDVVCREQVSVLDFPVLPEFTGNFDVSAENCGFSVEKNDQTSVPYTNAH
jgi:hypothetical protein